MIKNCSRCRTGVMVASVDGRQCAMCGRIDYDDNEVSVRRHAENLYADRFILPYIGNFPEMRGIVVSSILIKSTESVPLPYSGFSRQPLMVFCPFCNENMSQVSVGGINFARWPHYRYRCQYDHRISIPTGMRWMEMKNTTREGIIKGTLARVNVIPRQASGYDQIHQARPI